MEFKMKIKITEVLIYLFLFGCIITPATLDIKEFALALIIIINCKECFSEIRNSKSTFWILYIFIFPIILCIFSILVGGGFKATVSNAYLYLYFLILLFVQKYKINYEKIFIRTIFLMELLTIIFGFLDITGILTVWENPIIQYLYPKSDIALGLSGVFANYNGVLFATYSLNIFAIAYFVKNNKLLYLFVSLTATVISGNRSIILLSVAYIGVYYFFISSKKVRKLILAIMVFSCLIVFYENIFGLLNYIFFSNRNSGSDAVRFGTGFSIIEYMLNNPVSILVGMGFGSEIYVNIRNGFITASEISYLELFRQMGIVTFSIFMILVLKPFVLINTKKKKYAITAYLFFLVNCIFNPYLGSAVGFCVMLYIYYKCTSDY